MSTGPKEEPQAEPEPDPPVQEDLGDSLFTISLTPLVDKEEIEIRIDRIQDGIRETVYNKVHKVDGNTITIPLKGKLDAIFEFYYDGIFEDEITHPRQIGGWHVRRYYCKRD